MTQQLTLNIGMRDGNSFSSFFVTPENAELLGILKRGFEQHCPQLFLWGKAHAGKSHLLQAYCETYHQKGLMAAYLPLGTCAQYGVRMLNGLENKHLIALDEVDAVIGKRVWEKALMNLSNHCRANGIPLLFAGRTNPRDAKCALADFSSRLLWGPNYQLHVMEGNQCVQAMTWRARQRGFDLSDHVIKYIERHYSNDMETLMRMLERLDAASLIKRRKITREFIREVMQQDKTPELSM